MASPTAQQPPQHEPQRTPASQSAQPQRQRDGRPDPHPTPPRVNFAQRMRESFRGYFWFILKNVIGWILIIGALPLGVALPGPGGLPVFLIGFALVTFPGKRRLTARVMRGRRMQLEAQAFTFVTSIVSVLAVLVLVAFLPVLLGRLRPLLEQYSIGPTAIVGLLVMAAGVTWLVTRLSLKLMNLVLRLMPRIRRFIRPWLRSRGFKLLPPRRKREAGAVTTVNDEEILEIHERHHHRLRGFWTAAQPWLRRAVSLAITIVIFVWVLKPLVQDWPVVRGQILATSPFRFLAAVLMFAGFLFAFRAMGWRYVLQGFGHRLPVAAATRIWSISELARYLPGAIWQVVGRIYLVRPYGVNASVCSTSQVLELTVFLLANILVAVAALIYFGMRQDFQGPARAWLLTSALLVPVLAVLLHPRLFYGAVNAVLARLNKPPLEQRLGGWSAVALLAWAILGLLWQSVAVWLITTDLLHLEASKWWVVAGAYCLSWCAGFLAVWAPGGIGVREVIFMAVMLAVLPQLRDGTTHPSADALLAFLSVLLRVWATAGELVLAGVAIAADFRGALGHPDAPGRAGAAPATAAPPAR